MTLPADVLNKSLLPPNAADAERAIEDAMRMDVDLSAVGTLWNPATCPAAVLPFLGWGLAIAQFLHTTVKIAEKHYARYSPSYMQEQAKALDW